MRSLPVAQLSLGAPLKYTGCGSPRGRIHGDQSSAGCAPASLVQPARGYPLRQRTERPRRPPSGPAAHRAPLGAGSGPRRRAPARPRRTDRPAVADALRPARHTPSAPAPPVPPPGGSEVIVASAPPERTTPRAVAAPPGTALTAASTPAPSTRASTSRVQSGEW